MIRSRPRKVEAEFLLARVREEIERSKEIAPAPLIEEYRQAEAVYARLLETAR